MMKIYRFENGSIYWHRLYFDYIAPKWAKNNSPVGGSYNYAYYFICPWKLLEDWYYNIKWFIQRGKRGYSDSDVWGWYSYMAHINVVALEQLANRRFGHPCGMTMRGWTTRLLKMADGFQAILDEEEDYTSYKKLTRKAHLALIRSRQTRFRRGLALYAKCFLNLWDFPILSQSAMASSFLPVSR